MNLPIMLRSISHEKPNISKRLEKKHFLRGYQAFCDKLERNAISGSFKEKHPATYVENDSEIIKNKIRRIISKNLQFAVEHPEMEISQMFEMIKLDLDNTFGKDKYQCEYDVTASKVSIKHPDMKETLNYYFG